MLFLVMLLQLLVYYFKTVNKIQECQQICINTITKKIKKITASTICESTKNKQPIYAKSFFSCLTYHLTFSVFMQFYEYMYMYIPSLCRQPSNNHMTTLIHMNQSAHVLTNQYSPPCGLPTYRGLSDKNTAQYCLIPNFLF